MHTSTHSNSTLWRWPEPFIQNLRVAESDTDRLGHTNNVQYLRWLEEIAWAHITYLGCDWGRMNSLGFALAITRTEIDYLAASYAGDTLSLGTWISANDRRFKCAREFQLLRQSDNKTLLMSRMEFACISLSKGRPAKMPEQMIEALDRGLIKP